MDVEPVLEDGRRSSAIRCTCPDRANLVAEVKDGLVVFAGCPVCQREGVVEILPDGEIGFFPMGVRVF
jgi:hypothetical protein